MSHFIQLLLPVLATIIIFLAVYSINEWFFRSFEFSQGINWVYLPAGIRLLCTLLFREAGFIGLLIAGLIINFAWLFPDDAPRAVVGALAGSLAPYLVYLLAQHLYGLHGSLAHLTPARLLVLSVAYSVASPALHHVWFAIEGKQDLLRSFVPMFVGDLLGTLIVIYTIKMALSLVPRRNLR